MGLIRKLEGNDLLAFLGCVDRVEDSGSTSENVQKRYAEDPVEYVKRIETCKEITRGDSSHNGKGTLYVTTKRIVWKISPGIDSSVYLELMYPVVLMHAVCRDVSSYPHQCLYLQLDEEEANETECRNDSIEVEKSELEDLCELRFALDEENNLQKLFEDFCFCASLHPDADDDFVPLSAEEEQQQAMDEAMNEEAALAHFDSILTISNDLQDGRFDDAEEQDSEPGTRSRHRI